MFKLIKPYIPYWLLATLVGVFTRHRDRDIPQSSLSTKLLNSAIPTVLRQVLYMLAWSRYIAGLDFGQLFAKRVCAQCIGSARRNYVRRLFAKH